jgi:hypothetical protein
MKTQINAHFTQRDFLPGITSGLAVIQEQSGKSRPSSGPVTNPVNFLEALCRPTG